MRGKFAIGLILAALAVATLLPAAPAQASFHLMKIREVGGGNFASFNDSYVELQMYAAGQNLTNGHTLNFWDHDDATPTPTIFTANVANGKDQATILIGDTAVANADATNMALSTMAQGPGAGGALICWENIDCVSIGTGPAASVTPPSPVGSSAPFPFTGEAIQRTITRGCATALDPADDTNNSGADFSKVTPNPRNNAAPITEKACASGGGTTPPPGSNFKCKGKKATLIGTAGKDKIKGTAKRDVIVAFGGNDTVKGLGGNDVLCGKGGRDRLIGGKGKDLLVGGAGADKLVGGAGKDTLSGQGGKDICNGGPGSDTEKSCGRASTSVPSPGPVYR